MTTSQWYTKTKVDQLLANAGGTTDYSGLTNKPTLGTAAAQNSSAFDVAGAANAVETSVAAKYVSAIKPALLETATAVNNRTVLDAAIAAAISSNSELLLPPGTFNIDNSASPVTYTSQIVRIRGAVKSTKLIFTSAANNGLVVGPVSGANDIGPAGYVRDLIISGPSVPDAITKTGKAALTISAWRFGEIRNVYVSYFDVGFDLVNNCYGTGFHQANARYNKTNVGLRLRTGIQNGDDIPFFNCWLSGRTAAIWLESDPYDGTAGFYFWGGQFSSEAANDTTDHPELGAVVIGKNYDTGVIGGEPRQLIFWGGDFEGVHRRWALKMYTPCSVAFQGTRFDNNGTGGTGGNAPLGLFSHANPGDDAISLSNVFFGGTYKTALLEYSSPSYANPQLVEIGTQGKPNYYPAGASSPVNINLYATGILPASNVSKGVALLGGQQARVYLDGLQVRNTGGQLEVSNNGLLWTSLSLTLTANVDGSFNFTDTGWGIATDGAPTFYGRGSVPAGRGATAPIFAADGSAVLIPTGV